MANYMYDFPRKDETGLEIKLFYSDGTAVEKEKAEQFYDIEERARFFVESNGDFFISREVRNILYGE